MEPIVLVGGGEVHYRFIQSLSKEQMERPIILVSQNIKVLGPEFLPYLLKTKQAVAAAHLDLWSACQRKGVYFLEDTALAINREDKSLHLKKFGRLKFHRLSVESPSLPSLQGQELADSPFFMNLGRPYDFLMRMEQFFAEVHKHCPREVRVVFTGWDALTLQLADAIRDRLQGGCEAVDLLILDNKNQQEKSFFKSKKQKEIEKLKKQGIRVMPDALISEQQQHLLKLVNGQEIAFDILIANSHYRAQDSLGKILQMDSQKTRVRRDLTEVRSDHIFVVGRHVQFEKEGLSLSEIVMSELSQVLLHNILCEKDTPHLQCRNKLTMDPFPINKDWEKKITKKIESLRQVEVLPFCQQKLAENLDYQAQHMSRPWQGFYNHDAKIPQAQFRLNSFNGFNSWGSYALSAIKITEMALLKSLSQGVHPQQIRFNLTLPKQEDHLLHHIFESTFRAIESVALKHNVELEGGDTFDGQHWHLNITVGGRSFTAMENKFRPHDYLIITRPLGFGFLWAGRLNDQFNSTWIQKSLQETLLATADGLQDFIEKWQPSGRVLIEEWGFLFHCLQKLPAHQQLMVNLREVPRWQGTDQLINQKVTHPGLDLNWNRIQDSVAFDRNEVSLNNSILWDSLSQGSLVFGFKSSEWKLALADLQSLGYQRAALVGCIRPKSKGNSVVLSDWSPA